MKKFVVSITILISFALLVVVEVAAQNEPDDNATYVLTKATKDSKKPNNIDVSFGKSFPSCKNDPDNTGNSPAAEDTHNWVITSEVLVISPGLTAGARATITPTKAEMPNACGSKLVSLTFNQSVHTDPLFDPATHKITITYKQGNFPDVRFERPEEEKSRLEKTFTSANDKDDADIYVFGSAAGAHKSKPIYSIDAKLGYFRNFKKHGRLGPKFTFTSDEGSDVDPDSITLKLAYENIFVLGPAKYLFLNVDAVGGEFDKEGDTRNFISGVNVKYVPRSVFLSETNIASVDFTAGVEGGHNFKNAVDADGSGGILRLNFGLGAHFVALAPWKFKRININGDYLVRLPQRREIFIEKIGDDDVFTTSKRPRHLVDTNAEFMFSDAIGLTVKYEYGSLPPSFKLVDHNVSAGFTVKFRQNR